MIADVRFRRDAGELNVYVDVVYPQCTSLFLYPLQFFFSLSPLSYPFPSPKGAQILFLFLFLDDLYPFFPWTTDPEAQSVNSTMFGNVAGMILLPWVLKLTLRLLFFSSFAGFELMLGPTPSTRTSAAVGDTRLFFTGIAKAGKPHNSFLHVISSYFPSFLLSLTFHVSLSLLVYFLYPLSYFFLVRK